jgi:tRNA modification GTPase
MTGTIYALSSAPGRAGVAVIRISGSSAVHALSALTDKPLPPPRTTAVRSLKDPATGDLLDSAMVIFFEAPASFTGEKVVELHCHGSPAVVDGVLSALSHIKDCRMAEPGEFTRRAFENGKMDLTAAEAVADLIDAETQAQRQQALAQMGGALSSLYNGWAETLKKSLAYTEAVIDFPDEDVPDDQIATIRPQVDTIIAAIDDHLNDNHRGERLRGGINVAVIGPPNAGKSSLVNALARRDVAIVSDLAGTTRDIIEVHLDLGGFPVILADTAGLRPDQVGDDAHGKIESEGIRRALERARNADIRLLVFDGTEKELDSHTAALINSESVVVINKCDLFHVKHSAGQSVGAIEVSVKNSQGVDKLLASLENKIQALMKVSRDTPSLTRARHRTALEECRNSLVAAMNRIEAKGLPELVAEDLRMGVRSLGRITGRVDVEDLLDVIFRDFCIGK